MAWPKKAKIITPGDDPNCVHWEDIHGLTGTCRKCGQVRDYSVFWTVPEETFSMAIKNARPREAAEVLDE